MTTSGSTAVGSTLGNWMATRRSGHCSPAQGVEQRIRFAFLGRVSTHGYQDPESSLAWQLHSAQELIGNQGVIVARYFDVGCSRRVALWSRPEAGRLLRDLERDDRGFDAIVVGEADRAFCGRQLVQLGPLLARSGVQIWLPETLGPVDLDDPAHVALVLWLGSKARREVERARFRTTAAMREQVHLQGRFQGGRPPFGYRLVDAGPHPNSVHAAWGRRLRRLEPDPVTGPWVTWMFQRRLDGWTLSRISRELNSAGVPCPAGADPDRNRHRTGGGWILRTVASILENPRYTGWEVWNRQGGDHETGDDGSGETEAKRHWNPAADWVMSRKQAHPALVSQEDFVAAQETRVKPEHGGKKPRTYLLTGLVVCGLCGRRMAAHWGRSRPAYRCRHGHSSAKRRDRDTDRIRNLYAREDMIINIVRDEVPGMATATASEVAAELRRRDVMITVDRETVTITVPQGSPGYSTAGQVALPGL